MRACSRLRARSTQTTLALQPMPLRLKVAMSVRILKWWTIMDAMLGVGVKQEQDTIRASTCAWHSLTLSPSVPRRRCIAMRGSGMPGQLRCSRRVPHRSLVKQAPAFITGMSTGATHEINSKVGTSGVSMLCRSLPGAA